MSSWKWRAGIKLLKSHLILTALGFLALATLLMVGFSCSDSGKGSSAEAPFATDTVLMIVLEGVSPEDLTRYALQSEKMPALAKFARESTWFDRHWAQSNSTNGAFASLMSGVYASRHGVGSPKRVGREGLSSAVTLISEDLQAAGFDCIASVGTPLFSDEFSGFNQGWSKFACREFLAPSKPRSASHVVDAALPEFTAALSRSGPVFGLFEFCDALQRDFAPSRLMAPAMLEHLAVFEEELPEIGEYLDVFRRGADGGVSELRKLLARRRGHPAHTALDEALLQARLQYIDEQFARLVALLAEHDRYQDGLIVVTGNQGPHRTPGDLISDDMRTSIDRLRVPLLVRLPGGRRSQPVQELTQAIDVRATITAALGLGCADSDGVSLLSLMTESEAIEKLHSCALFEDSLLGFAGAVDDFWIVKSDSRASYSPLDVNRAELLGVDLPPVPKTMLERTRERLREFAWDPHVEVELTAGLDIKYTVGMAPLDASFMDGRLLGTGARDVDHYSRISGVDLPPWGERIGSGLSVELSTSEPQSERSGFSVRGGAEPFACELSLDANGRELDESSIFFGDRDLAHVALPRLSNFGAEEWGVDSDGNAKSPIVDVSRESGRWLNVQVGGEPGRDVALLLVGQPFEVGSWLKLLVRESDRAKTRPIVGRPDCVWVEGTTPLSVSVEAPSARGLGLSVAIQGKQVSVQDVRFLGKRFAQPGTIRLAVMSWLPGVRERLRDIPGSSQPLPDAGTLRISFRTGRRFANDRPVPSYAILDKLQTLGSQD